MGYDNSNRRFFDFEYMLLDDLSKSKSSLVTNANKNEIEQYKLAINYYNIINNKKILWIDNVAYDMDGVIKTELISIHSNKDSDLSEFWKIKKTIYENKNKSLIKEYNKIVNRINKFKILKNINKKYK